MKSFLEWFKASTKIKRWMFLIIIGISLTCYAFSKVLVTEEMSFFDLGKIILLFVLGFIAIIVSIVFIQKRTLEIYIEANDETSEKGKKSKVNIKSLIFNKKVYDEGPKVVVIGGGQGLDTVIEGMKKYTNNITAIVTMSDYGNVPTQSRKALDTLPLTDIKNSIIAMSDKEDIMKRLLNLNFDNDRLRGLNFGDVYLTAMNEIYSNISEAILKSTEVLNITGKVLPVTLDEITICAELTDGTTVKQKDKIPETVSEKVESIDRIYISPSNCRATPGVIEAIADADAIIIGPGSLYTNVLPNLLVKNIAKSIRESKALKFYVSNIMTEPGQTDNYSLSEHFKAIKDHVGTELIDYCIVDTGEIVPEYIRKYNKNGSDVVEIDTEKCSKYGIKLIKRDMSCIRDDKIRHNPDIIASTIIEMICNDLKFHDMQNDTEYLLLNSVLKEQKKIQNKEMKRKAKNKNMVKKVDNKIKGKNPRKTSKFKEKYKDRVDSIQNTDAKIKENRKIAEEIERMQREKRKEKQIRTQKKSEINQKLSNESPKLNSNRISAREKNSKKE